VQVQQHVVPAQGEAALALERRLDVGAEPGSSASRTARRISRTASPT